MASSSNQTQQQQPVNYSGDANNTATSSATAKGAVVFDEELFLFLPRLGEILKSLEENPNEVKNKIEELKKQFESCQEVVSRVEGIDTNIDDQRIELNRLDLELKSKTDLLKQHINMCKFDLNMPAKVQLNHHSEPDDDLLQDSNQFLGNPMNINDEDNDEQDGDPDDEDEDDLFQTDDPTNLHHQASHESFSNFFS